MNRKERANAPSTKTEEQAEREVLKGVSDDLHGAASEIAADLTAESEAPEEKSRKSGPIAYNRVQMSEMIGTLLLGILSGVLLIALLRSHRRERRRR